MHEYVSFFLLTQSNNSHSQYSSHMSVEETALRKCLEAMQKQAVLFDKLADVIKNSHKKTKSTCTSGMSLSPHATFKRAVLYSTTKAEKAPIAQQKLKRHLQS